MNRHLKILLSVSAFLSILQQVAMACAPDCGDCQYWDGEMCMMWGECDDVWDCSGCQRCVNCYCEDQDYYCRYWHDACWYCSNGVCINPCTAGQVCINGQCVTVSIVNVAVSKANPIICEDVTFTATTDPPQYASEVTWSAPGGEPSSDGPSATFTTHWPCIGTKTVTATLGSLSRTASVNVGLPNPCTEGSERVRFSIQMGEVCPESECSNPNYFGCFTGDLDPTGSYTLRYSGCAWVWDVDMVFHGTYGVCYGNFTNYCSIDNIPLNDRTKETVTLIIQDLLSAPEKPTANCESCTWMHEGTHYEAYAHVIYEAEANLADDDAMNPIAINCANEATRHCLTAEAAYGGALGTLITDVWTAAREASTAAEYQAYWAGINCNRDVARSLCSYAAGRGWDIEDCNGL